MIIVAVYMQDRGEQGLHWRKSQNKKNLIASHNICFFKIVLLVIYFIGCITCKDHHFAGFTHTVSANCEPNLLVAAARERANTPATALPLTCTHSSKRAGWFS